MPYVLNALSLKLNDLYGQVDQIQGPAEEAKAETPSSASNTSEKSVDPDPQPTPVQNFFSMHGPTDDTEFDCDLCYDGAQFDLLAAQHAAVDDPIAFFQFYHKRLCTSIWHRIHVYFKSVHLMVACESHM